MSVFIAILIKLRSLCSKGIVQILNDEKTARELVESSEVLKEKYSLNRHRTCKLFLPRFPRKRTVSRFVL